MPDSHQTPASRRFLQPSSLSRSQNTLSATRKTQFPRPSQPASSSPFSRTAFPNRPSDKDEIETSFEEESVPSPPSTTQSKPSRAKKNEVNSIKDYVDEGHAIASPTSKQPQLSFQLAHRDEHDQFEPNLTVDGHSPRAEFSSPLPKRQKIAHATGHVKDAIHISSSPSLVSDVEFPDTDQHDISEGDKPVDLDVTVNDWSGEEEEELEESLATKAKFRLRSEVYGGTQVEQERQAARSAFKGVATGKPPWLETPLPTTFSPSKRKGKQDYVYGGAAETVRNWILDIANEHIGATEGSGHSFDVTTTSVDASGRFELVKDNENVPWMLVHQDHQPAATRNLSKASKSKTRTIALRGAGTSWDIDTLHVMPTGDAILHVAVLWNDSK